MHRLLAFISWPAQSILIHLSSFLDTEWTNNGRISPKTLGIAQEGCSGVPILGAYLLISPPHLLNR
ncbi:hypothetical protein WG66_007922 [Moniliophthora roreri]|nr:hypothetical protein WG66_007922 [Moniliophthora roreri]